MDTVEFLAAEILAAFHDTGLLPIRGERRETLAREKPSACAMGALLTADDADPWSEDGLEGVVPREHIACVENGWDGTFRVGGVVPPSCCIDSGCPWLQAGVLAAHAMES